MAILTLETYEEKIVPNKYDKRKNKESLATRVCIKLTLIIAMVGAVE